MTDLSLHPMARTKCMHAVPLNQPCFRCHANAEQMKRDMLAQFDRQADVIIRGTGGGPRG